MITFKFIHIVIYLVINSFNANINYAIAMKPPKIHSITSKVTLNYLEEGELRVTGDTISTVTISREKFSILMDVDDIINDRSALQYMYSSERIKIGNRDGLHIYGPEEATYTMRTDYTVPNRDLFIYPSSLTWSRLRIVFGKITYPFAYINDVAYEIKFSIKHPGYMKCASTFDDEKTKISQIGNYTSLTSYYLETSSNSSGFAISNYFNINANDTSDGLYFWVPDNTDKYAREVKPTVAHIKTINTYLIDQFNLYQAGKQINIFFIEPMSRVYAKHYMGLIFLSQRFMLLPFEQDSSYFRFYTVKLTYIIAYNYIGHAITPVNSNVPSLPSAIAGYLQFKSANFSDVNFNVSDHFGVLYTQHIFLSDVDDKTNHLNVYDDDIIMNFDFTKDISIMRLTAVLRMFEQTITVAVFNRGITKFVEKYRNLKHRYDYKDFVTSITAEIADEKRADYLPLFDSDTTTNWIKSGYPVVLAKQFETYINFSQQKFSYVRDRYDANRIEEIKNCYVIPITLKTSSWVLESFQFEVLMDKVPTISKPYVPLHGTEWILLNIHQYGYYRVNYDVTNWIRLRNYLFVKQNVNRQIIPVTNRAQLIDDSFQLARAGMLHYDIPLTLSLYLIYETNYVPWQAAINNFEFLLRFYSGGYYLNVFKNHILSILTNHIKHNNLELFNSSVVFYSTYDKNKQLYLDLLHKMLCKLDDDKCVDYSVAYFKQLNNYEDDNFHFNFVPVSMRETVYCTAIRNGGVDEWELLKRKFDDAISKSSYSFTEIIHMLKALSCTRVHWLLVKQLNWVLSHMNTSDSERQYINFHEMIKTIVDNDVGKFVIYNYLHRNKKEILTYDERLIKQLFSYAIDGITHSHEYNDYDDLITIYGMSITSDATIFIRNKLHEMATHTVWRKDCFSNVTGLIKIIDVNNVEITSEEISTKIEMSYKI